MFVIILLQIDDAHCILCVCAEFFGLRTSACFLFFFFVRIITHEAFKTKIMKRRKSKKQVSVTIHC